MKYLDTSIRIDGGKINLFIGPEYKKPRNTIFFNKPFVITNSTISSFRIKISFLQHLVITNSRFNLPIVIDSTNFDTLFIEKSTIQTPIILNNTRIRDFRFVQNYISDAVVFSNCSVDYLNFDHSIFPGDVDFDNCTLKNLSFQRVEFNGSLNLSKNSIGGKMVFDSCYFQDNLILSSLDTSVQPQFSFFNTVLPDTLDFSFNKLHHSVDLTKVNGLESRKKCNIILYGTDVNEINLDYLYFKLIFPLGLSNDKIIAQYEGLLDNFKKRNYLESYKLLDIEYREFKARQETPFWWFVKLWSNYGYNPERVFYWTAFFIFLFTVINSFCLNTLLKDVYQVDFVPLSNRKIKQPRFWFSLIYTAAIFFALPIKWDKINFSNKGGTLYLFLQFIIGMICLWYIGKFIL